MRTEAFTSELRVSRPLMPGRWPGLARAADTGKTGPDRTKPELLYLTHRSASASDGIEGRASKKVTVSCRRGGVGGGSGGGRGDTPFSRPDEFLSAFLFSSKEMRKNMGFEWKTVGAETTKVPFWCKRNFLPAKAPEAATGRGSDPKHPGPGAVAPETYPYYITLLPC